MDRLVNQVVEAVLDRGPIATFTPAEPPYRFGEQMRSSDAAPRGRRRRPCRASSDLDLLAVGERCAHRAARRYPHEHRLLGQFRPDRGRGVEAGRAVGKLEPVASGRTTFTRLSLLRREGEP